MAIPRVAKQIKKSDFTLRPIKVNKEFNLTLNDINDTNGYLIRKGFHSGIHVPINDSRSDNDLKNPDGSFQATIWSSINHMFYADPYSPARTYEHLDPYKTYKDIHPTLSHISIPYLDLGERMNKESLKLVNYNYPSSVIDDGYGNLITTDPPEILTNIWKNEKLVAHWSFNELYKDALRWNNYEDIADGEYEYIFPHSADPTYAVYTGCKSIKSIEYSGSDTTGAVRVGIGGSIRVKHNEHYNLVDDDFIIHMKLEPDAAGIGHVMSKRGVRNVRKIGITEVETDKGLKLRKKIYYEDDYNSTNVYPYDIYVEGGEFIFSRSDGNRTTSITIPFTTPNPLGENWQDLIIMRYTDDSDVPKISAFLNGSLIQTVTDETINPYNDYDLIFGSESDDPSNDSANIGLDEIRFYSSSFYDSSTIVEMVTELAKTENMFYSNVIGNVFYRTGNIVITSPFRYYDEFIDNLDLLSFKSTHTIYEYEVLCRIGKGEFNLTMNPTARVYKSSDMLNSDFTNGSLRPYFTEIGLYNEAGELLVVGKLGQPIQSREDVDINVMIKWEG